MPNDEIHKEVEEKRKELKLNYRILTISIPAYLLEEIEDLLREIKERKININKSSLVRNAVIRTIRRIRNCSHPNITLSGQCPLVKCEECKYYRSKKKEETG